MQGETSIENKKNGRAGIGSFVFWLLMGIVFILIDQLVKFLAFKNSRIGSLGFWISKQNFLNKNFAFSLPLPGPIMAVVYFIVMSFFIYYIIKVAKNFNRLQAFASALILAGGISNIIERLALGGVRDFIAISLNGWTGFYNFADFYIIAGIVILLFGSFKSHRQLKD